MLSRPRTLLLLLLAATAFSGSACRRDTEPAPSASPPVQTTPGLQQGEDPVKSDATSAPPRTSPAQGAVPDQGCPGKITPFSRFPCAGAPVEDVATCRVDSVLPCDAARVSPKLTATVSACGKLHTFTLDGRTDGAWSVASLDTTACHDVCEALPPGDPCSIKLLSAQAELPCCGSTTRRAGIRSSVTYLPTPSVAGVPEEGKLGGGAVGWMWPATSPGDLVGRGIRIVARDLADETAPTTHLELVMDQTAIPESPPMPMPEREKIPINAIWVEHPEPGAEPLASREREYLRSLLEVGAPWHLAEGLSAIFAPFHLDFTPAGALRTYRPVHWSPGTPVPHVPACAPALITPLPDSEQDPSGLLYATINLLRVEAAPSDPESDCVAPGVPHTLWGYKQKHLNVYVVPWLPGFAAWAHAPGCVQLAKCDLPPAIFVSRSAFVSLELPEIRSYFTRIAGHEVLHLAGMSHRKSPTQCARYQQCEGGAESLGAPPPTLAATLACSSAVPAVPWTQLTAFEAQHVAPFRWLDTAVDCSVGSSIGAELADAFLQGAPASPRDRLLHSTARWELACDSPMAPGASMELLAAQIKLAGPGGPHCAEQFADASGPYNGATCEGRILILPNAVAKKLPLVASCAGTLVAATAPSRATSAPYVRTAFFDAENRLVIPTAEVSGGGQPELGNWVLLLCLGAGTAPPTALSRTTVLAYSPLAGGKDLATLTGEPLDPAYEFSLDFMPVGHPGAMTRAGYSTPVPGAPAEFPLFASRYPVAGVFRF